MAFFNDLTKAILSVLVVLCLFELGLRVTGTKYESSFYESDPVMYMALRPNAQGWQAKEGENFIRINSLGMRDRERTLLPPAGETRIALLGDSLIAAEEVPFEKTVGQVLESKLQVAVGPDHRVEVLNFGVGGYTLSQEFLLLQARVWAFHPDIVILVLSPSSVPSCDRRLYPANIPFFMLQDGKIVPDPRNRPPAASSPEARRWHALFGDSVNQVRLLQMVRKATQDGIPAEIAKLRGAKRARNANILNMWLRPPSSAAENNAWSVAEGILAAMSHDAQVHGAEFWLSAVGPEIEENPSVDERNRFLAREGIPELNYAENRLQSRAQLLGISFISLEREMLNYAESNHISLRGFFNTRPNYGHWNEDGNSAAANFLAQGLLSGSPELRAHAPSPPKTVAQNQRTGRVFTK